MTDNIKKLIRKSNVKQKKMMLVKVMKSCQINS